jgi:hypothetical protein
MAAVVSPDGTCSIIDLPLVTALEVERRGRAS